MMEIPSFEALGIDKRILKVIQEIGFEEPSPVQAGSIPVLLEGKDLIGQAPTGTGKTAAFVIPILQGLTPGGRKPQALILEPTRELALQVAEEVARFAKYLRVRELAVYGGQPIQRQIRSLQAGVQVVIGTPGRLLDHIHRGTLQLDDIRTVVLDEADEMLDMGFLEDIEAIIGQTPPERQTVCFSATMPPAILELTRKYLKDPVRVTIRPEIQAPAIEQAYFEVRPHERLEALTRILDMEHVTRGLIFCATKRGVDELTAALQARGYLAGAIHGDLNQSQRQRVLRQFREGKVELLVATDVAARGLDIDDVSHVINYDIASDAESHVHRVGRTGRAGRKGTAFTLVHPREVKQLRFIERLTRTRIPRRRVPTPQDVAERRRELLKERVVSVIEGGHLGEFLGMAEALADEHDSVRVAAAALKLLADRERAVVQPSGMEESPGAEPGMARLFVNMGRRHHITPSDIVRTIAQESGIPGKLIGAIDIHDDFTFVEVPEDKASQVLASIKNVVLHGQPFRMEPARPH